MANIAKYDPFYFVASIYRLAVLNDTKDIRSCRPQIPKLWTSTLSYIYCPKFSLYFCCIPTSIACYELKQKVN